MKLAQIIAELQAFAPLKFQESYDNSGLLTGNIEMSITKALLSLDCTEEVVQEAINKNCNLIICHHPIIFTSLKQINGKNYVERTIIKAIKNDIAIYAIHTNLDNMRLGVNHKIAQKLNLKDIKVLNPTSNSLLKLYTYVPEQDLENVKNALFEAGAGSIGNYTECSFQVLGKGNFKPNEFANPTIGKAGGNRENISEYKLEVIFNKSLKNNILKSIYKSHSYEEPAYEIVEIGNLNPEIGSGSIGILEQPLKPIEFLKILKSTFNAQCVKHTKLNREEIKTVAICGGSGSFLLPYAKAQKADIYVSADFKYHEFFDAENDIIIADIGHYESEQFTTEIFYEVLSKKITNFAFLFSETYTNPINYF